MSTQNPRERVFSGSWIGDQPRQFNIIINHQIKLSIMVDRTVLYFLIDATTWFHTAARAPSRNARPV